MVIAFHSGDNCVPHGRSVGPCTILQSSLLAIGGIKPNSKWAPVDTARWYHDHQKPTSQTSMWACRKTKLLSKFSRVTSPNYGMSFSNHPPSSRQKSTTVWQLFTTGTVQRLGAADQVTLASGWMIWCANTCTLQATNFLQIHRSLR